MKRADPAVAVVMDRFFALLSKIRSLICRGELKLGEKDLVLLDCAMRAVAGKRPLGFIFNDALRIIDCRPRPKVSPVSTWVVAQHIACGQLIWDPNRVQFYQSVAPGQIRLKALIKEIEGKFVDEETDQFRDMVPLNATLAQALLSDQGLMPADWGGTLVFLATIFGDTDGRAVLCLKKVGDTWQEVYLPFEEDLPADYKVVLWRQDEFMPEGEEIPSLDSALDSGQMKKGRFLPHNPEDIRPHPRVFILDEDDDHFFYYIAFLLPGESVCWRCGTPHHDPNRLLDTCPTCGGDFND